MVFQSDVATGGDVDRGSFRDLDLGLGRTTGSGGQKILASVDQVFFTAQLEDSLVGVLNLKIAVPGSSLGIFDVESSQARFVEVGLEHLTSFAVMHLGQFETVLQFSGREQLVFLVLVDGQDVVLSRTGQGHVGFRCGQCHGEGTYSSMSMTCSGRTNGMWTMK